MFLPYIKLILISDLAELRIPLSRLFYSAVDFSCLCVLVLQIYVIPTLLYLKSCATFKFALDNRAFISVILRLQVLQSA